MQHLQRLSLLVISAQCHQNQDLLLTPPPTIPYSEVIMHRITIIWKKNYLKLNRLNGRWCSFANKYRIAKSENAKEVNRKKNLTRMFQKMCLFEWIRTSDTNFRRESSRIVRIGHEKTVWYRIVSDILVWIHALTKNVSSNVTLARLVKTFVKRWYLSSLCSFNSLTTQ